MNDKYTGLLDHDLLKFVQVSEACYPADASQQSIEMQRTFYDELCRKFDAEIPSGLDIKNDFLRSRDGMVPIRRYSIEKPKPGAAIVYYHGGGYVLGSLESHHSICAEICQATGYNLIAVDYRLAPEYPHPAAFDDCLTAMRRTVSETGERVILVGDSAGGNMAAAVSLAARVEESVPSGQVLIYPALGNDRSRGSHVEHADAPLLGTADMLAYDKLRKGNSDISNDPTAHPLASMDLTGVASTVAFGAQFDPLCDDAKEFCMRATESGASAHFVHEVGLVHGYLRARHVSKRAGESFRRILAAIEMLAENRWNPKDL